MSQQLAILSAFAPSVHLEFGAANLLLGCDGRLDLVLGDSANRHHQVIPFKLTGVLVHSLINYSQFVPDAFGLSGTTRRPPLLPPPLVSIPAI